MDIEQYTKLRSGENVSEFLKQKRSASEITQHCWWLLLKQKDKRIFLFEHEMRTILENGQYRENKNYEKIAIENGSTVYFLEVCVWYYTNKITLVHRSDRCWWAEAKFPEDPVIDPQLGRLGPVVCA